MSAIVAKNTITQPDGVTPIPNAVATIALSGGVGVGVYPGFVTAGSRAQSLQAITDSTGTWQASLVPNDTISPAGTKYHVVETAEGVVVGDYYINVLTATTNPTFVTPILSPAPGALAAPGTLAVAANLSDVASAATARTNLGLGTAATQPSSAFDASGAAASAQAASVPVATVTTLGDLIVGTGAGTVARQAAGTNFQIPIFDSTSATGFRTGIPSVKGRAVRCAAIGDSITIGSNVLATAGAALASEGSWFELACYNSRGLLRPVYNDGIAGTTSAQMLARFDANITPRAPDVVFICAGTNDPAAGITLAQSASNIDGLVKKVKRLGAIPVLCELLPNNGANAGAILQINNWLRAYTQIAGSDGTGVDLICWYAQMVESGQYGTAGFFKSGGGYNNASITTQTTNTAGVTLPQATIAVTDSSSWGASGTVWIGNQLVTFTGNTGTSFTGCTGGTGSYTIGSATISHTEGDSTHPGVYGAAVGMAQKVLDWADFRFRAGRTYHSAHGSDTAGNLLTNGNFISASSGIPTGWTLGGTDPGHITHSLVAPSGYDNYPRPFVGSWYQQAKATGTVNVNISQTISTGFAVGDLISLAGRCQIDIMSAGIAQVDSAVLFSGAGLAALGAMWHWGSSNTGHDVDFYMEMVVPASTTALQVILRFSIATSPCTGSVRWGEVTLANLNGAQNFNQYTPAP